MVDHPGSHGKMCDWQTVNAVDGASDVLALLSQFYSIYIATNADNSAAVDIEKAFIRVGLAQYISGYFCKANLGCGKADAHFYPSIINLLGVKAKQVTMVGDSVDNDVLPALKAGLDAVWFNRLSIEIETEFKQVKTLRELC
ncbi:hydrolase [Alteromonadales bacterium alter-6D02]|nr:hydrolase [Alteromonadales bacterium alter-6D02]